MVKTKTVTINEHDYQIKQLGGSWKARLLAKKISLLGDVMLVLDEKTDTKSRAFKIAYMKAKTSKYESPEFVAFVKEVTIEADENHQWTPESWEIYFSTNFADLRELLDEILEYNLGEGDKKKDTSTESETSSTTE